MRHVTENPRGIQLVRFVVVGAGANLILLVLAYLFRSLGMPAFSASAAGYVIAFAVAYSAQHSWTFGGGHSHRRVLPRYLVAQLICAAASGMAGHIAVAVFAASAFWMSVAATVMAAATSYLLSTYWVFAQLGRD